MTGRGTKVGFIGLGAMGAFMAGHVAKAGFDLMVYDLDAETVSRVAAAAGTRAATGLGDIAGHGEFVITCLPNGDIVREVVLGDGGLAESLDNDTLLVDMSSSDPLKTRDLGTELATKNLAMIDAPVSGGVRGAEAGTLTIMAGGDAANVERARPVLEPMSAKIFHTGSLGTGQAMKALNNLCSAAAFMIVCEALEAGGKFGLNAAQMIDILNVSTGRNNSTENKFKQYILTEDYAGSRFAMDLMVKDVASAKALGTAMQSHMPLGSVTADLWRQGLEDLGGAPDHTEIARWIAAKSDTGD
jgi:3-hydroxyisobutyrate dehydrogenase